MNVGLGGCGPPQPIQKAVRFSGRLFFVFGRSMSPIEASAEQLIKSDGGGFSRQVRVAAGRGGMRLRTIVLASFGLAAMAAFVEVAQAQEAAQRPSSQQQRAVSGLNGKFSLEGGAIGSNSAGSSALAIAQGSITAPLGNSFGLQVDGGGAQAFDTFVGGGAAHLFWRNPQIGLVGPIVALMAGGGATIARYGGEAELYKGIFTLRALAGYQSASLPSGPAPNGGFWQGRVIVYPIDDLALSVGGGQSAGFSTGRATLEWQPDFVATHNVSLFVDSSVGDDASWRVTSGVRFYFGPEKTLIRRQREDDPDTEFDCEMQISGFSDIGDSKRKGYEDQIKATQDPRRLPGLFR